MSPIEYIETYHNFRVNTQDLQMLGHISRYKAGAGRTERQEYETVISKLIQKYKVRAKSPYDAAGIRLFFLTGHASIHPNEPFYGEGIKRAYDCRGTPEEISDATRLALAAGQCTKETVQAYVTKWFGLDCNTLVGNWLGLSSGTSIPAYVNGYRPDVKMQNIGGTPADEATRKMVPLPAAPSLESVESGSVLVTYRPSETGMNRYEHIALVENFLLISKESPTSALGAIAIVEWGSAGGAQQHISMGVLCNLVYGAFVTERPNQKYWAIKKPNGYRLILNMTPEIASGVRRKYGVLSDPTL